MGTIPGKATASTRDVPEPRPGLASSPKMLEDAAGPQAEVDG